MMMKTMAGSKRTPADNDDNDSRNRIDLAKRKRKRERHHASSSKSSATPQPQPQPRGGGSERRGRRSEAEDWEAPPPNDGEEYSGIKKKTKKMSAAEKARKMFAAHEPSFRRDRARDPQPSLNRDRQFEADPSDHCETPFAAYRDIEPFLYYISRHLKKDKASLVIYDPYYCEGSVVGHLGALGFTSVINRHEDFYRVIEDGRVPEHDVLVSNPPFSGDHMERVVRFAQHGNRGRPWLLLMPNFMCRKPTYHAALRGPGGGNAKGNGNGDGEAQAPFYMVPSKRYSFWSPGREFKADVGRIRERIAAGVHKLHGKHTAPFECMWFCQLRELGPYAYAYWNKKYSKMGTGSLARCAEDLPEHASVPKHEKRKGAKARRRIKKQRGAGGRAG